MDERLVAWARAFKARTGARHPVLWLFTDAARLPDPMAAIAALPRGLCGVVFRHDGAPGRAELARRVAALCRRRGVALSIAGDWRLAVRLRAGVHLRAGRGRRGLGWTTASAHGVADLRRGLAAGALVFLSPIFPTDSHPGARALGPARWARLAGSARGARIAGSARGARIVGSARGARWAGSACGARWAGSACGARWAGPHHVLALGGVTGERAGALRLAGAAGAGAIGALAWRGGSEAVE